MKMAEEELIAKYEAEKIAAKQAKVEVQIAHESQPRDSFIKMAND